MPQVNPKLDSLKIERDGKYATKNPISRRLLAAYFTALEKLVRRTRFTSVLEVGCGEGVVFHMLSRSLVGADAAGIDVAIEKLKVASDNIPQVPLSAASAYRLPFSDESFDLVLCCEVLEHLEDPEAALAELDRVGGRWFILSVPNEPLWRAMNIARGAYWRELGNTPGHLRHWSPAAFRGFLGSRFRVEKVVTSTPWTLALCRKA